MGYLLYYIYSMALALFFAQAITSVITISQTLLRQKIKQNTDINSFKRPVDCTYSTTTSIQFYHCSIDYDPFAD